MPSQRIIEGMFIELREQAFRMGIIDPEEAVKISVDSTFMKAYSRRGRGGGISDRGARVGRTERRSYRLGGDPTQQAPCQLCP